MAERTTEELLVALQRRVDRSFFSQGSGDPDLRTLLYLGQNGFSFAVGMIVDGVALRGIVGVPEPFMTAADAALDRAAEEGGLADRFRFERGNGPFVKAFADYESLVAYDETRTDKYLSDVEDERPVFPLDEIDAEDVPSVFRAATPSSWITLSQVAVGGDLIAHMRVRTTAISAWWPLDLVEGAEVTYSPPGGEATGST